MTSTEERRGHNLLGATVIAYSAASDVTGAFTRGCSSGSQFKESGWHLTVSAIITISAGVITHPLHTRTPLRLEAHREQRQTQSAHVVQLLYIPIMAV
jgi:hypothetical protein